MYVYQAFEPNVWTVGYYEPGTDAWVPVRDLGKEEEAIDLVSRLNGGTENAMIKVALLEIDQQLGELLEVLDRFMKNAALIFKVGSENKEE